MKKTLCITALAALVFVSGCQAPVKAPELKLTGDIGCVISSGGEQYECTASYVSDSVYSLEFSAPKELEGLKYSFSGGVCTVSMGTLMCRSDGIFLPDTACPMEVMRVIKHLRNSVDEIKPERSDDGSYYAEYDGCRIYSDTEGNVHLMIA